VFLEKSFISRFNVETVRQSVLTPKPIEHYGIVLDVGEEGSFDSAGASFGCVLQKRQKTYLFYSGAKDVDFGTASIGLAISRDGETFEKIENILERRVGSFCDKCAMTPAVFSKDGRYYMVLAGNSTESPSRKIGIATAEEPTGPWRVQAEILSPMESWEGYDIDCGPGICESEALAYYSNVSQRRAFPRPLKRLETLANRTRKRKWWQGLVRRLGILMLRVGEEGVVSATRFKGNPLSHLNGLAGTWNESLFCPGYLELDGDHYLFVAASTYSAGPPLRQYVGLVSGSSPYFGKDSTIQKLVDGPAERRRILPSIKGEVALDTPSPVIRDGEIWLYYGVMDRADNVWRIALSTFAIEREQAHQ
jgi:hypothetical protein